MAQKYYFPLVGTILIIIAFAKDMQLAKVIRYSLLPVTLLISATMLFMGMVQRGSLEPAALGTLLFLVLSTTIQTFFTKGTALSTFVFVKSLLLFLLFTYLSMGSSLKLFAVVSAGVCLLDALTTIQRLCVATSNVEATR
jgi:hypothetical protein